jgi:hypothetical protein
MENYLPQCNWCKEINKAEWVVVYGESTTNHYSFCCTKHFPELLSDIGNGKFGKVKMFYAIHFSIEGYFDERWNNEWKRRYNNLIPKRTIQDN